MLQLLYITAYALDGYAHTAETLTGEAIGARRRRDFDQAVVSSTLQSLIVALLMSATIYWFGPGLITLFTNQADVIAAAKHMLPWLVAMPLLSIWSYQLDGIYIGITRTREMRNGMLILSLIHI